MELENRLDNIFTSYDDSIFADGSIDPMGILIIWTSLGNRVFHNKINTISTDIRYYTLNLFHHHLLQKCTVERSDEINMLIRKPPYINKSDLYEGILIFLENLLAHSILRTNENQASNITVPGLNKLKGLLLKGDKNNQGIKLIVNRASGILIRQHLLGIHGRHKGPFMKMGILLENAEEPYANSEIWKKVEKLFSQDPWKSATTELLKLINTKILSIKPKSGKEIEYKVEDILSSEIIKTYHSILNPSLFSSILIKNFWEDQLGLYEGTAANLFNVYKGFDDKWDFQGIIKETKRLHKDELIEAIVNIEPFLTCIDKMAKRMLFRENYSINESLINAANYWLASTDIHLDTIETYLNDRFFNQEAIIRLKRLTSIYSTAKQSKNPPLEFITQLIQFHHQIMKSRGHMHWISLGLDNRVTIHKSLHFTDYEFARLTDDSWVNSYYLPTLDSLYKGLTVKDEII